jgi:alkylated DNA repair dioxygenase AlkB
MNLFQNIENINDNFPIIFPNTDDYKYKWNEKLKGYDIEIPDGELFFSEDFFNVEKSNQMKLFFTLTNDNGIYENIAWNQDQIKIFGKLVSIPRLSAYYGDIGKVYKYSGLTLQPKLWNKELLLIKNKIENISQTTFNSVLMNYYRNGEDYMGWHADAEKELGENPIIASINFGASRKFRLRKNDNHQVNFEIVLKNGSLLIMKGKIQHQWQHTVPKEKKVIEERINLTFRMIKT